MQAIAFGGDLRRNWRMRESTKECEGCDWQDSQSILMNRITYFTNTAMDLVKELPYWHRSQGRDHFWLPTADWSRCYGAPPLFTNTGEMFALATLGEVDFHYLPHHPIVMPQGSTGLLINTSRINYGALMLRGWQTPLAFSCVPAYRVSSLCLPPWFMLNA